MSTMQPGHWTDITHLIGRDVDRNDPRFREHIVRAYTPLIKTIVSEFITKGPLRDDLLQVGYMGLLMALANFDSARGVTFATYARPVICGHIRHYLRDHSQVIRRPRWLYTLNRQIESTVEDYVSAHKRFPTTGELAMALNVTEEGVGEILKAREAARTEPLDMPLEADEIPFDQSHIRRRTYESFRLPIEDRIVLLEALEELTALQRRVVYYRFFRDLSQRRTAEIVGVSQRHVSRVLDVALVKLRELLSPAQTICSSIGKAAP